MRAATAPAVGVVEQVAQADGFDAFFEQTWPELVAFCITLTGQRHLGEEVAQEAFTRVYVRYPALREPRPYLFRVAANLVKASWRKAQRDAAFVEDAHDAAVPAPDTATIDAVRRLDPRLRDVVLLHYYADLSVEDVARALKRPTGTVKRRLFEARARLAETLGDLA
ncbi:MAG: RNA polymerase sigma factor [Mycobacteriales bacterium]|nr:RNA polymerase sigma factor [Mycobacteriales bacterium]